MLGVGLLDVFGNHHGLAQTTLRGFKKRNFAHERAAHQLGMAVTYPDQLFLKRNAFFQ